VSAIPYIVSQSARAYFRYIVNPITAAETTAGVAIVDYTKPAGDVRRYGATGDGATDDLVAFQRALSSNQLVTVPPTAAGYRLSAGITVPVGTVLWSNCFLPGNPPKGTRLIFDLAVATCVTVGGAGSANGTAGLQGLTVTRAAGTIPAGSIGVLVQEVYNVNLRDVTSGRHDINWRFYSPDGVNGISANAENLHAFAAQDMHWEFDGWPEFRCLGGRTGQNNAGDIACNGYIRVKGGSGVGGSGPNTISFVDYQFNQGAVAAGVFFVYAHPANPGGNAVEYRFDSCHIENVSTAGITSDASSTLINRFQFIDCTFNAPGVPFLSLNAATQVADWFIQDSQIYCSTFTLAPTPQISNISISNNKISGTGSITGAANSLAYLSGNTWGNGLTLAGGAWADLVLDGDNFTGGNLTLTATGKRGINLPSLYFPWTPQLQFGGANVGMTTSRATGVYRIVSNRVEAQYSIVLTAVGSSTGAASIAGLPTVSSASTFQANTATVPILGNMTGLTGSTKSFVGQGASVISLMQSTATGEGNLTNAAFTATSTLSGEANYLT